MPFEINRASIYEILKEVAREVRKTAGKEAMVEIVIVGGASILLNYTFRDATRDIDAIAYPADDVEMAARRVADKYGLSPDWLNSDFRRTDSFSRSLREVSRSAFIYNNGKFDVRTVGAEYLIAMKAVSARKYRNDISDIIGTLYEEAEKGNRITYDDIVGAATKLYGGTELIQVDILERLRQWTELTQDELKRIYQEQRSREEYIHESVIEKSESIRGRDDIDTIVEMAEKMMKRQAKEDR